MGWDSPRGILAAALVGSLLVCANPLEISAYVTSWLRVPHVSAAFMEIATPPRAGSSLLQVARTLVARTGEYLRSRNFGPSDKRLDSSNSPGLYFLFDRRCPIRYYEVPFYESSSAQEEVIAAVLADPHVRSALVSTGLWSDTIDGISNFDGAPRVAEFIRREFHPAFSKDGVEFWDRNAFSKIGADGGWRARDGDSATDIPQLSTTNPVELLKANGESASARR